MIAPFERFVALRYLRGAKGRAEGQGFLRFIIFAAVGGVTVGVAALLLALAVVRGFSSEIEEKIVGFGAHVQVHGGYGDAPIPNAASLEERLGTYQEVQLVAPVVEDFALLRRTARQIDGVTVMGTRPVPAYLEERLIAGSANLSPNADGHPGILVGTSLASRLHMEAGDSVAMFSVARQNRESPQLSPEGQPTQRFERPRIQQFHVAGVFETSLTDFDDVYVITDLDVAQEFLGYQPSEVTRFDLRLSNVDRVDAVASRIEEDLGFPFQALTIYQVFSGLFAWVNLQQTITPLIIGVIIVVAAFNVIGTLLMLMMEKAREIGILSGMGASSRSMQRLFLWVGGLIGVAGVILGEVIALGMALIQQRWEVIPLPAEAYYMTTAPIELNALDFVLVGFVALILCVLSAYIPARVASRLDPVRTIRFQ